jgi:hypothetical protein
MFCASVGVSVDDMGVSVDDVGVESAGAVGGEPGFAGGDAGGEAGVPPQPASRTVRQTTSAQQGNDPRTLDIDYDDY